MTEENSMYKYVRVIYNEALLAGNLDQDAPWLTGLLAVYEAGYNSGFKDAGES